MGELARVVRDCDLSLCTFHGHAWERLNPATMAPFRRGRVVFLCGPGWRVAR